MDFFRLSSLIVCFCMLTTTYGARLPLSNQKHDAELHPPRFGNCPSLTSGPTITELLDPDNNGVERLVIFAYRLSGTAEILVFTPSKEYQHCIEDFPANTGKFNRHYESQPIKEMFENSNGRVNYFGNNNIEEAPEQSDNSNEFDNQAPYPWDFQQSPYHEPSNDKYLQKPKKSNHVSGYPQPWDNQQSPHHEPGKGKYLQKQKKADDITGYPKAWDFFQNHYNDQGKDLDLQQQKEVNDVTEYPKAWDLVGSEQENDFQEHEYNVSEYPKENKKNTLTGKDEDVPPWQIPLEQYTTDNFPVSSFEHPYNFENDLPETQNENADTVYDHEDIMQYDAGSESSDKKSPFSETSEYSGELSELPAKEMHVSVDDISHQSENESNQTSEERNAAPDYQFEEYLQESDKNQYFVEDDGNTEEDRSRDNEALNQDLGYVHKSVESESYEISQENHDHTVENPALEEEETTKSSNKPSNSNDNAEYESPPWFESSSFNKHPRVQEGLDENVADHWIQVPRGDKQDKQNGFSWIQVPSTTSQPGEYYWESGSKTHLKVPHKEPEHTLTYHQNINDGTVDFNQWFNKQLEAIKNGGTEIPTSVADINTVKGAIENTLRDNGLRVISPGILQDGNGKISRFSNLKLQPLLIGRSVPYNRFVEAPSMYDIPENTPFLEGLLVTMLKPPRLLGIVPLGVTALSRKLRPNGKKVFQIEGRKLNPVAQRALKATLNKIPEAYGTHPAASEAAPLTEASSNPDLKNMWLTFSDILKKKGAVTKTSKLDGSDKDLETGEDESNSNSSSSSSDEEDKPGFRIIGGSSATGTGTPLAYRGRSGFQELPFYLLGI